MKETEEIIEDLNDEILDDLLIEEEIDDLIEADNLVDDNLYEEVPFSQTTGGQGRNAYQRKLSQNRYQKNQANILAQNQKLAKETVKNTRESNNNIENSTEESKNNTSEKSKGKLGVVNDKINNIKSKYQAIKNPKEAASVYAKDFFKKKILMSPIFWGAVFFLSIFSIIIFIVVINTDSTSSSSLTGYYSTNTGFWWPTGGEEIIETDSGYFAVGVPYTTNITSPFGMRDLYGKGEYTMHNGIDVGNSGYTNIPIIASKSGTISAVISSCEVGNTSCGGSYGNFIIIDHEDGISTLYAHLASTLVSQSDTVTQGQVIGYMGTTGHSTGVHLHFEVRIDGTRVDPEDYISAEDPRPNLLYSYILNVSLTSTSYSKTEFKNILTNYCASYDSKNNVSNCTDNFANNSDLIYDTSIKNGINPELVVAYAEIEKAYKCPDSNCWGAGHYNESSSGFSFDSLEEGIIAFANIVLPYNYESNSYYSDIKGMAEEASSNNCGSASYIVPNTLVWVQSKYSYIGKYLYNPGNWGLGGCIYINTFAQIELFDYYNTAYYNSRCSVNNTCSSGSEESCANYTPTVCETNDYSLYTAKQRADILLKIFYPDKEI